MHFSLWDGDRNVFYDGAAPDGLSEIARSFIAGVLDASPGTLWSDRPELQLVAPDRPALLGGRFRVLGYDNREAPVRVASPLRDAEEGSTNVELKSADASCNPYLAVGGLVGGGSGRDRARTCSRRTPSTVDPATLPQRERENAGIVPMPATQREALDALADDRLLCEALGPTLAASYLAVRRSEWEVYSAGDETFEQQGHFEKY